MIYAKSGCSKEMHMQYNLALGQFIRPTFMYHLKRKLREMRHTYSHVLLFSVYCHSKLRDADEGISQKMKKEKPMTWLHVIILVASFAVAACAGADPRADRTEGPPALSPRHPRE